MYDYDFCDDKTPPRVFVLGMAATGKSTFINLAKENWEKANGVECAVPCPDFIEVNDFDLNFDFKDELGDDVISEICFCHDITVPFSDEENNVIKKIKEMINGNEQIGFLLILTKSDLISTDKNELNSIQTKMSEEVDVVARMVTKNDLSEESQLFVLLGAMGASFGIRRLQKSMEDFSDLMDKVDEVTEMLDKMANGENINQLSDEEWRKHVLNVFDSNIKRIQQLEENLPKIFADTMAQCTENPILADAIKKSLEHQIVLFENDDILKSDFKSECSRRNNDQNNVLAKIVISKNRTFKAASAYKNGKVCVLNFANSFTPGGCVRMGTGTQEEALCRCSTLYPCISEKSVVEKFYTAHYNALESGAMTELANDDIIYTPDVIVFKSDTMFPELLSENEWFNTDVITCAAPNLSGIENYAISKKEFRLIHYRRGKRIFELAKAAGVDHLVLGAFGCGAFHNPPDVVADVYKKLVGEFWDDFMSIEFAIYCDESETENYKEFVKVFGRY